MQANTPRKLADLRQPHANTCANCFRRQRLRQPDTGIQRTPPALLRLRNERALNKIFVQGHAQPGAFGDLNPAVDGLNFLHG